MMVQWVTRDAGRPRVRWGTAAAALDHSADGSSTTYTRADMCGPPANTSGWMEPGWLHAAVMAGLAPSTRYFYQYGDEVQDGGDGAQAGRRREDVLVRGIRYGSRMRGDRSSAGPLFQLLLPPTRAPLRSWGGAPRRALCRRRRWGLTQASGCWLWRTLGRLSWTGALLCACCGA